MTSQLFLIIGLANPYSKYFVEQSTLRLVTMNLSENAIPTIIHSLDITSNFFVKYYICMLYLFDMYAIKYYLLHLFDSSNRVLMHDVLSAAL